ncbi:protein ecdysoneless [Toxorhynchites rutilus septentrionalis]|uniref:protein ecdysoneless n=1 Tax=Toxorhynchites rutilus septentrionalis TaxID=329112 RepID=UPI002479BA37|nr:protein ecdysoneless [Toxorhynchites rutilus septentrionalis]
MSLSSALKPVREDDFVEYFLFPAGLDQTDVSLENCEPLLESLLAEVDKLSKEYCQRYIWHRDGFKVIIRKGDLQQRLLIEANDGDVDEVPLSPHLYGITHFGDNVQDEWFIVSLLFHLTRRISGLAARVVDSDGEFLLIEAADHLPSWANPERCEGRVFIYDGALYLIADEAQSKSYAMKDILGELQSDSRSKWVLSKVVQSAIDERIRDFPDKIEEDHHRATLYVPVGVAAALKENPQLISAAVLAFYNRDPIDLKVCRAMRFFPPESCVYTSAIFTKCLYAMLMHSNYLPDRRTGWSLPLATAPEYKAHILGLKLACGFEILASQAKASQSLETDKGWKSYFDSLNAKGYFQDNIPDSQEYSRLLGIAQDYYRENRDSMRFTPKIGEEIVSILKRNDYDVEELRKEGLDIPSPDDDSWINISPEELDQMLTKRYGARKLLSLNGNTDAEAFTSMVNDFLDQKSEFDGVDQDAAMAQLDLGSFRPVKPKRRPKTDVQNHSQPSPNRQPIDFDSDAFAAHVKNLLDLVIPEDRWDSSDNSDMSDYAEDEYDRNIEDMSPTRTAKSVKNEIQSYMDQMDRELAKTTIGKSFETTIGEPGERKEQADVDDFDDIETFKPVDIDVNTLKNMMESYQAQIGGPGPSANLLGSMGVHVSSASNGGPSKTNAGGTKQTDV